MGPSSDSIMIIRLKLFKLPNMDPYLVQHVHIIKCMPKLKFKNYNINLIKIYFDVISPAAHKSTNFFPISSSNKIVYVFFTSSNHAPSHIFLLDLTAITLFHEGYKLWRSSLCNSLHLPAAFSLLALNAILVTLSITSHNFGDYLLTYGAEPFLRSRELCSYSRNSQHSMQLEGSLPCSQGPCARRRKVLH
jgi:membrane-bound metal-dependent hydrolase YbcI (DUF457 family)